MDGADPERWSAVAAAWAELWGGFAEPAWRAVVEASGTGPGSRVLDVGCGAGDFLVYLDRLGASPAGIDPAPGMVELALARVPGADVRLGSAEDLPWPNGRFDLVTSFNALQFADDMLAALAELVRVTWPDGLVAVSNWAEADRNDLTAIEDAVASANGEQPLPDGETRQSGGLEKLLGDGGLEKLLGDGGLEVVAAGLVEVPWQVPTTTRSSAGSSWARTRPRWRPARQRSSPPPDRSGPGNGATASSTPSGTPSGGVPGADFWTPSRGPRPCP